MLDACAESTCQGFLHGGTGHTTVRAREPKACVRGWYIRFLYVEQTEVDMNWLIWSAPYQKS